jgi:ligand-binding sensor protein
VDLATDRQNSANRQIVETTAWARHEDLLREFREASVFSAESRRIAGKNLSASN